MNPPVPPILARPRSSNQSRPNRLVPHLEDVENRALELLPECSEELETVVSVAAYLHDFGKLNAFFQQYIHARDRGDYSETVSRKKRSHAYLGAFACQHVLRQCGLSKHWQAVGFLAVAKHHATHLNDFRTISEYMGSAEFGPFTSATPTTQVESILENEPLQDAAGEILSAARPDDLEPSQALKEFVADFKRKETVTVLKDHRPTDSGSREYIHLLRVWSTLTCADKLSSAGLPNRSPNPIDPGQIPDYIETLPEEHGIQKTLNNRREQARKTCVDQVDEFLEADVNIGRITLPTGFGKTLTGTQTALELAQRKEGRVIYALPYTSIIDQTDDIFQSVFGLSPLEERYTVHHHLAETRTRPTDLDDGDNAPFRDQHLLAESWQADLVLTTFVQLFESVVSPTNTQSIKLPALQDSVILIDEPQALSHSWWRLITYLCTRLADHYNIHIIFMTATQPGLFQYDDQAPTPFEFLPESGTYYDLIETHPRVEFRLHESVSEYVSNPRSASPLPISDAATEITAGPTESTLVICNTIRSTTELSSAVVSRLQSTTNLNAHLKELLQTQRIQTASREEIVTELVERVQGETVVSTLTTRLRPIDRKLLIAAIRQLTNCEETSLYVISTQLVEAGVDISFNRLYRDIAPIPSIVQAAGRCNREFSDEASTVTVWRLSNPRSNSKPPSYYIYTNSYDLLYPTREALAPYHSETTIEESVMIGDIVDRYYERLHSAASPGDHSLVTAVQKGKFGTLANESLISDEYPTADVVVCVDSIDLKLVRMYQEALEEGYHDWTRAIQRYLSSRTVSIPVRDTDLSEPVFTPITEKGYYFVDASSDQSVYSLETAAGLVSDSVSDRTSF